MLLCQIAICLFLHDGGLIKVNIQKYYVMHILECFWTNPIDWALTFTFVDNKLDWAPMPYNIKNFLNSALV